jgi:hypothetical protein
MVALAALLVSASGCGAGECNRLFGSAESSGSYDLVFEAVEINRQESADGKLDAMTISYVRGGKDGRQIPVKVIAKAPVASGEKKDIANAAGGGITRAMVDHSTFPALTAGNVTFEPLGNPGEQAEGTFYTTFENGRTLNGDFCGVVQLLKL